MPEPLYPGRCDSCGGPIPAVPDPRISRSRQGRLCSNTCQKREQHRREYRRMHPELARESECLRKDRFGRRDLAERSIARHGQQGTHRPYPCPWDCGYWHVGSYGPMPEGGEPG